MKASTPAKGDLYALAKDVGQALLKQRATITTAESCTGGGVAQALTAIAGSSGWFERGFVTYSNVAKREMLGVKTATLSRHGAVSERTAREMAEGALKHSRAQVAIAITGIAGPDGGSSEKPIGTVWFAWAQKKRATTCRLHQLNGDRESIRRQSVAIALEGLLDYLVSPEPARRGAARR